MIQMYVLLSLAWKDLQRAATEANKVQTIATHAVLYHKQYSKIVQLRHHK